MQAKMLSLGTPLTPGEVNSFFFSEGGCVKDQIKGNEV